MYFVFNLVGFFLFFFPQIKLTFTSASFPTEQIYIGHLGGGLTLVWIPIDAFYFRMLFLSDANISQVKISLGWCVGVCRSVTMLAGCWEVCFLGACCGPARTWSKSVSDCNFSCCPVPTKYSYSLSLGRAGY